MRTLASYAAYYAQVVDGLGGPGAAARRRRRRRRRTCGAGSRELIDPLRFPADGLADDDVGEIRRIKARVDAERLPRGADPHTHIKLGRGGLADVEWTVQLLQMQHAGTVPGLRTTADARGAAARRVEARPARRERRRRRWPRRGGWSSRVRNAIDAGARQGRPTSCPATPASGPRSRAILGYAPGESDAMVNDYLRTTRRARAVVERVFWE